jgi:uncharacterized protein (DUF697 family)
MLGSVPVFAQIGIGTTSPAPSAALEVSSTGNNKGILIPRINATQKAAIASPAEGLLVYQTTAPIGFYYYTGTAWKLMAIQTDLASKVDKVNGKDLSSNDYTTAEKTKLSAITGTNTGDQTTITGNAATATNLTGLTTSVATLNNLSGVNSGDQTTITGNAATATKLATSKNINGVAFDGSEDITIPTGASAETLTGTTLKSTVTGSSLTSVGTLGNLTVGTGATALEGTLAVTGTTTLSSATVNGKVIVGASSAASASAVLEASSTTQGFLPPRLNHDQRTQITSPVAGLTIWCNNCGESGQMQVFNGSAWKNMVGAATDKFYIANLNETTNTTDGQSVGQSFTTTAARGKLIKIVTTAIGGVDGTQLTNGIAQSYLRIRSYVNDNEITNPNALSGAILATSNINATILNYNYGKYYPTVEFNFPIPIELLANKKYVIQFVAGPGVGTYVKIDGTYSGGQAYDINGINLSEVNRDMPFQLYLQEF